MKILKITTIDQEIVCLNVENISCYYYDEDGTHIETKDHCSFIIKGNVIGSLTKLITSATNGTLLSLE